MQSITCFRLFLSNNNVIKNFEILFLERGKIQKKLSWPFKVRRWWIFTKLNEYFSETSEKWWRRTFYSIVFLIMNEIEKKELRPNKNFCLFSSLLPCFWSYYVITMHFPTCFNFSEDEKSSLFNNVIVCFVYIVSFFQKFFYPFSVEVVWPCMLWEIFQFFFFGIVSSSAVKTLIKQFMFCFQVLVLTGTFVFDSMFCFWW